MLPKGTLAPNSGNISSNMTRAQIIKTQNKYCGKSGVVYVTGATGNTGFTGSTGPTGTFSGDVTELNATVAVRTPLLTTYGPTGLNIGTERATSIHIGTNVVDINIGATSLPGPPGPTGTINIGTTNTSTTLRGTVNVNKLTAQTIDANIPGSAMTIGANLTSSLAIGGTSGHTGTISLGAGQTTGILNIGTGARSGNGAINIGTQAIGTIAITIGSTGYTNISLRGPTVDVSTKLTTPRIDSTNATTSMTIGNNLTSATLTIGGSDQTSDINIATGQTSGNLNIGTGARLVTSAINIGTGSGALNPITIGGASSTTTVGGTLTVNGNIAMGSTGTIFTTLGQQIRLGHAHTQAVGSTASSFGPFFKSFGPVTLTSDTYDILYDGENGLFTSSGIDGVGGLLTIIIKSTSSKMATLTYNVMKRDGVTGFNSLTVISNVFGGWSTNPTISAGTGNNIQITFIGEGIGATVSWLFMGA